MRRLTRGWVVPLGLLAAVAATLWVVWRPAPSASGVLETNGRIEGDAAAIASKVGGRLARVAVRAGASVREGDVIAELSSAQLEAQREQAEHGLHTMRERLTEAQAGAAVAERQAQAAVLAATREERESQAWIAETEAALGIARARLGTAERVAEAAGLTTALAERESRARIGEAVATLGAARAGLRQAEADRDRAVQDHARAQALFARELIAAQELDQAGTARSVAVATVDAARQRVAQAEDALELARASEVAVALRRKEAETARQRVGEARAEIARAEGALERARTSRVAVALRGTEAEAAAARVREAQAAVETARAQRQAAEAGQRLALANVADARVVAPFAGTVLEKLVEAGEVVAAGTPLVTLVDLTRLHAKVYVREGDLAKVTLGQPARIYTDAFPRRAFAATVAEVAQQAEFTPRDVHMKDERVTLVFAVTLALQNPEGVLKPGMPVDARIRWIRDAPWGDGLD